MAQARSDVCLDRNHDRGNEEDALEKGVKAGFAGHRQLDQRATNVVLGDYHRKWKNS